MVKTDRFGNEIDRTVGYARGKILASSVSERMRLVQGQRVATQRLKERGQDSISIFTGNLRCFPVDTERMAIACEEWLGPGLEEDAFQAAALHHLSGTPSIHTAALFNRSSGALISAIWALSDGKPVVSAVPRGSKSHASISRGCYAARVDLHECDSVERFAALVEAHCPRLIIVTTVSSNLDRVPEDDIKAYIDIGRRAGAITFVDDAYGARIRPILHEGTAALQLGADLVVTNSDKAGMIGPRSGVMAGVEDYITRTAAKASECGMEARAPTLAGVTQSLQMFQREWLLEEAALGQLLTNLFEQRFDPSVVQRSDLGPVIYEDDLFEIIAAQAGKHPADLAIVPAEASSALGMILLRDHGVLTTNTHGQPAAKVSLRLRPTPDGIRRLGGLNQLVIALDHSIKTLAAMLDDVPALSMLLIGK